MDPVRDWREVVLPASVRKVVTMLSREERQLLHALGRTWTGAGAIVDGGCFLGGSTLALGTGLLANPRRADTRGVIHSYDLFVADAHQAGSYLKKFGDYAPGDSVRPIFDRQTQDVASCLQVHEGDLRQFPWTGGPIEILFIDVSKTWELNDFINAEFFPALIPGQSIVVQQDYVHPTCPWLAVTMEHYADAFEPVAYVPYNSMVYRVTAPLHRDRLATAPVSGLSPAERIALMDRALARSAALLTDDDRVELAAARCLLTLASDGVDAARDALAALRADYAASPRLATAAGWVEGRIARGRA